MQSSLPLSLLQLVGRLSMALTIGCCLYAVYFLLAGGNPMDSIPLASPHAQTDMRLIPPTSVLESGGLPSKSPASGRGPAIGGGRDIFSLAPAGAPGGLANTPPGQLPANLKIAGIVIADNPQVIIEDALMHKTYFIDADHPQAGIKMTRANHNQVVINYQGQDIPVPVGKQ